MTLSHADGRRPTLVGKAEFTPALELGQTHKLAVACFIVLVVGTNLRDEPRSQFVALSGDFVAVGNRLF
jgi:hypothetical protein